MTGRRGSQTGWLAVGGGLILVGNWETAEICHSTIATREEGVASAVEKGLAQSRRGLQDGGIEAGIPASPLPIGETYLEASGPDPHCYFFFCTEIMGKSSRNSQSRLLPISVLAPDPGSNYLWTLPGERLSYWM